LSESSLSPLWPADNPAVTAHISMLQGIINRLANNSASCKTWCLALVSALLSLAGASHVTVIVSFALLPVVVFGFLDAMYLARERAYRRLFANIAEKIQDGTYARNHAYNAKASVESGALFDAFGSWSIFPLYVGLLVAYGIVVSLGWLGVIAAAAAK
jgi:hypothetical protein